MAKYEFAICCKDELDLENGHKRKKQGDIIAFMPSPHEWGTIEIKKYLIIVIDNLTEEDVTFMTTPYYEDGILIPPAGETVEILAKRRCNIPLDIIKMGWYPNLDLERVEDLEDVYQPLKDDNIVIDAQEPVAIAYDKFRDSFKYATVKVIE